MRPPVEVKKIQSAVLAVLIGAFAILIFYRLGDRPVLNYDESIYAQVAREAMQNQSQLGFTWLGNIAERRPTKMWFEKPPVMIWLVEVSYHVFGINEFAARFWTAIFAILTLPLTFLFAKKMSQSFLAAILAVAAFFIAFQFDDFSSVLQLDIPVGFCVLLGLFSFWQSRENDKFYFLFWAALGLGLMIKSVIGLLPLPIILFFSLLAKDFYYLKRKNFWFGFLLFLAIVLPWHIIEQIRYGREFWQQYLFYHLLDRYSSTLEGNGGTIWFYADILFRQPILFVSLLLSLIYFIVKSFTSKAHLFVTVGFLFIFLFFSNAGTKLPPYILVIYPLAVTMIGMTFADFAKFLKKTRGRNFGNGFAVAIALFFVAAGFYHRKIKLAETNPQLLSDRAVGEFLKTHDLDQTVYLQSANGIEPAIIFYANRVVGYFWDYPKSKPTGKFLLIADVTPDYPDKTILFSSKIEKVYQIQ